jgi:flagellar motor protein MotB
MSKHKKSHGAHGAPHVEKDESEVRWLISYSDFMMQLVCLFILLYSVASIDQSKVAKIASAYRAYVGLGDPPGAETVADGANLAVGDRSLVGGDLAGADVPKDVNVTVEEIPGGWKVGFTAELFGPGSAELTAEGRASLDEGAAFLSTYAGQVVVTGLAGEGTGDAGTSDVPRLAAARAASAVAHLARPGFAKALDPRFMRAVGGMPEGDAVRRGRRVTITLKVD